MTYNCMYVAGNDLLSMRLKIKITTKIIMFKATKSQ